MRRLLIALLLLVLFPVTAEAALPLHRCVAIHEWLNWAPLAEDGSYRWPPYRSVADWLSASRPAPDWPKGNQFARIRAMGFDFVRLSVDPGPLLATSGDRRRQALAVLEADVRKVTAAGLKVVFNLQSVTEVPAYGPDVINLEGVSKGTVVVWADRKMPRLEKAISTPTTIKTMPAMRTASAIPSKGSGMGMRN